MSNNLHTDSCNGRGCCFCRPAPKPPAVFELSITATCADPRVTPAILAHAIKQALGEAEIDVVELSCKEKKGETV